jgi:ribonuclease Z
VFYLLLPFPFNLVNVLCQFQSTFLDDSISVEHAREYGHTHLSEVSDLSCYLRYPRLVYSTFKMSNCMYLPLETQITSQTDKLQNKAILLIHFSARYITEVG